MGKWIAGLFVLIIAVATMLGCFYITNKSKPFNFYQIYRNKGVLLNKQTGELWLVDFVDGTKKKIFEILLPETFSSNASDPMLQAINLVKNSYALSPDKTVWQAIKQELQNSTGVLKIDGWGGLKKDKDTFCIGFIYYLNGKRKGYFFDVHPSIGIVRNVMHDPDLIKYYFISGQKHKASSKDAP